jgi:diguanylate cyclase (GGDEF)-like protein
METKSLHILLVEDDEDDYLIARDLLAEIPGMRVQLEWTRSCKDGLARSTDESIDIFMVDFNLGECNGLEFLHEIIQRGVRAPVIILTGQGNYEIDLAVMHAGAMDYLVKGSFDAQLLERSIRYAIERSRLLRALNESAHRDDLTGLYNRREFNSRLKDEISRHNRYGQPLSLILFDLDHFKQVNDRYGHLSGDQVLVNVGQLLASRLRAIDCPVRFGGDEFAVILPETHPEGARVVAERLRAAIASSPVVVEGNGKVSASIPVTASIGVAGLPGEGGSAEDLVRMADQALYAAKERGRNCVIEFQIGVQRTSGD